MDTAGEGGDFGDDPGSYFDSFLPLVFGGVHFVDEVLRHDYAGYVVVEIAGHAAGMEDEDAGENRDVQGSGLFHEPGELVGVVDGLGLEESDAGLDFLAHTGDFKVDIRGAGVGGSTETKGRYTVQVVACEVFTRLHARRGADEVNDAEIEDGFGVGVVTGTGGIAGEAEDVLNAENISCEEVGLEGDPVAVSACELADGLDAAVEYDFAEGQGAEPHDRGILVGDVYCIDGGEGIENRQGRPDVDALGRRDLGGDQEGIRRQFFFESRQMSVSNCS